MKKYLSVIVALTLGAMSSFAAKRPNLLVILTDDQRTDTLGCYNDNNPIQTPFIDSLADRGVKFTNGFVTTPICVVSRACILTGRYESNNRVHQFMKKMDDDVFEHSYHIYLRNAGYFTGHFGKYGVGITKEQEKRYDVYEGQDWQGPKFRMYKGKELHDAEWLSVKTEEFLDQAPADKPWCLQLSYKEPHASSVPAPEDDQALDNYTFERSPHDTPQAFESLPEVAKTSLMERCYAREYNKKGSINYYLRQYHEKILSVERSVGKIIKMLEQRNIADNTVVVFLSDHGTHFGEKQLAGKWTPYDPSLRIPFIVYDPRPGARKGVVSDKMVLNIDVAPTLLELAGVEVPAIMDGHSMAGLMKSDTVQWRSSFPYEHFCSPAQIMAPLPKNEGVRTEDFKYVRWIEREPVVEELFDLRKDPAEMKNLVSNPEYAEKLKELRNQFSEWRAANPSTFKYESYGERPQSGAPSIDWVEFKKAHPEAYAKIAKQVKAMNVTWEQAVKDNEVRKNICSRIGYWY